MQGEVVVPVSFAPDSSYSTGGDVFTEPSPKPGILVSINVLNPVPDPAGDTMYSWNGSTSAPKIGAVVISTGAQVAAAVDNSGDTLYAEVKYRTA